MLETHASQEEGHWRRASAHCCERFTKLGELEIPRGPSSWLEKQGGSSPVPEAVPPWANGEYVSRASALGAP